MHCVSGPSERMHSEIKRCAGRLKDKITAPQILWLISLLECITALHKQHPSVCMHVCACQGADSRLGLVGLLLHDVQDHATGGGAAFGS